MILLHTLLQSAREDVITGLSAVLLTSRLKGKIFVGQRSKYEWTFLYNFSLKPTNKGYRLKFYRIKNFYTFINIPKSTHSKVDIQINLVHSGSFESCFLSTDYKLYPLIIFKKWTL